MNQRQVLVLATGAGASAVAILCVIVALLLDYPRLPSLDYALKAIALAVVPTLVSAALSAWVLTGFSGFVRKNAFVQSLGIVFLSYPIFLCVLVGVMSGWAYVKQYWLGWHVGHAGWANEAALAMMLAAFSFVVSVIPALAAEYFVIRFIRRRWQAVVSSEVVQ